jgi:hypothetical protein
MMNDELAKIAETKGWTIEEATTNLIEWWQASFKDAFDECNGDLKNADEDYQDWLVDAFRVKTSRFTGGSGKGDEYVGMIVADCGIRDTLKDARELVQSAASMNLDALLRDGVKPYNDKSITVTVCRAYWTEGEWRVVNSKDQVLHTDEQAENDIPNWAIAVPGQQFYVAMLSRAGKPRTAFQHERSYRVVVNLRKKFLSEGPFPEPILFKTKFDAAEVNLRMNVPIRFKAEKVDFRDGTGFLLTTNSIEPDYGLGWIDDEHLDKAEKMFDPAQYLIQFVPYLADLNDVYEYHEKNCFTSSWGNEVGPTFALKGTIEYIDHVGREFEWVEGGVQYSVRLSSNSMRRDDPNAALYLNVSKHLETAHHAFKVNKNGEWKNYTTGTQVIVVGKSRTYQKDNGDVALNIDAYNIYAIPSRSFLAETPTDESSDLGGLSGFRGDDA